MRRLLLLLLPSIALGANGYPNTYTLTNTNVYTNNGVQTVTVTPSSGGGYDQWNNNVQQQQGGYINPGYGNPGTLLPLAPSRPLSQPIIEDTLLQPVETNTPASMVPSCTPEDTVIHADINFDIYPLTNQWMEINLNCQDGELKETTKTGFYPIPIIKIDDPEITSKWIYPPDPP